MKTIKVIRDQEGTVICIKSSGFTFSYMEGTQDVFLKLKRIGNYNIPYQQIGKPPYKNIPILNPILKDYSKKDLLQINELTEEENKYIVDLYDDIFEFAIFEDYVYFVKLDKSFRSAERKVNVTNIYKTKRFKKDDITGIVNYDNKEGIRCLIQNNCYHNDTIECLGYSKDSIPLSCPENTTYQELRKNYDYSLPLDLLLGPAFNGVKIYIQPSKYNDKEYCLEKIENSGPYTADMLREMPRNILSLTLQLSWSGASTTIFADMSYNRFLKKISQAIYKERQDTINIKTLTINLWEE